MMAENPRWWSMSNMKSSSQYHHQNSSVFQPICPSFLTQYHESVDHHTSASSSLSTLTLGMNCNIANDDHQEQLPHSWSQLLVGGLADEEDKFGLSDHFHARKVENWKDHLINNPCLLRGVPNVIYPIVKHENSRCSQLYASSHGDVHDIYDHELVQNNEACQRAPNWSDQQVLMPISTPMSSVTSLGSNLFDFNKTSNMRTHKSDRSSKVKCSTSTSTAGVPKKAKVQSSPTEPFLKVKKEKLGDRITALHQIVSPFGKTDTASVLFEAIGYIRFFQGHIEALSSPYLFNESTNLRNQQSDNQDGFKRDLKTRGLCLVPISCTNHVGNDDGAHFWSAAPGAEF